MDDLMTTLYQKAKGYKEDEISVEYALDENGERRPVKEKVVTKYYAPDVSALKTYLEMNKENRDLSEMTDEELEREKRRLIRLLSPKRSKKKKEEQ